MVLTFNKDNYKVLNPLDDGNCAFNALALAFTDLVLGKFLEEYAKQNRYDTLIKKLNKTLPEIKDWDSFKKYLTDNKANPKLIQRILAPVFRDIALDLKEQDFKTNGINSSEKEAFQAEFRDHLYRNLDLPIDEGFFGGDIYHSIPKFQIKFDEAAIAMKSRLDENKLINLAELPKACHAMINKTPLTEEQKLCHRYFEHETNTELDDLNKWFSKDGYTIFLEYQRLAGKWAGDIELAPVAELLGINIKTVNRANSLIPIHNFHGVLTKQLLTDTENQAKKSLNESQIRLLKDRGIIDRSNNKTDSLFLMELDESDLISKLSAVANNETIIEHWLSIETEISSGEKKSVPDSWLPNFFQLSSEQLQTTVNVASFHQLIDRGVIRKDDKSEKYVFIKMDLDVLCDKLQAIEDKEEIIKLWKKNYTHLPLIILSNPDSLHWYYYQPNGYTHWEEVRTLEVTSSSIFSPNYLDILLSRATDWDGTKINKGSKESEEPESKSPSLTDQQKTMQALLHQLLAADEQQKDSGSLKGDDGCDLLGVSPPSSSNLLVDPSIFKDSQTSTLGDFDNLPIMSRDNEEEDFFSQTTSFYEKSQFFLPKKTSPSVSPPYKKSRQESPLKAAALRANEALQAYLNNDNSDIQEHIYNLLTAFNLIAQNDEIPYSYSLQLLLPREYLSSFGYSVEFLPPKEVIEFAQNNMIQILLQANTYLVEEIKLLYINVVQSGNILNAPAIALFNRVFYHVNKSSVLRHEIIHLLKNFDLSEIDNLKYPSLTEEILFNLKKYFTCCKLVAERMDIKLCAKTILSYPEIQNHPSFIPLFKEIQDYPLESVDLLILTELINIPVDSISNKNLACAIASFIKLFQQDIIELLHQRTPNLS